MATLDQAYAPTLEEIFQNVKWCQKVKTSQVIVTDDGPICVPPALAERARGRDHVKTAEFADVINKSPQTVRKKYCLTGECYGIRPLKVGNDLLWPVVGIARLLNGGAQ